MIPFSPTPFDQTLSEEMISIREGYAEDCTYNFSSSLFQ